VTTEKVAGLSASEARSRLQRVGPNEPAPPPRGAGLVAFLALLANPLVAILLIASAVSAALGDSVNATLIALMVALSTVLNFVQSYRSQRAAARLREEVAPRAVALRDGAWTEIARRDLVPGDAIRLAAGDRVPADARLVEARDLHLQQAALTGESMPTEKSPGETVHLGTSVVSGTAIAEVTATGRQTMFGDIAARLSARPPETEFERGTRQFALLITRTVLFLLLFVVVASLALRRPPLESLLFAVALAVGLTPEFLPMITTVTLARGAVRMARRRVIVKHLSAIEDFGSMDVLCSDKTGTLTAGEMKLEASVDPLGRPAPRPLALAWLNSVHETGIASPLDAAILREGSPDTAKGRKLDEIPFDFERRRLSVVVDDGVAPRLIVKGAPESVLALCVSYDVGAERRPLDNAARARCAAAWRGHSERGARVLAVAERVIARQGRYSAADERELTLVGFVTFADPPAKGVAEALAALRRDGVRVVILTGDSEFVARHVCDQVRLDAARIVLGEELDRATDGALAAMTERTDVFARVSPAQKNRIILALKSRGHVVGFLGDGINDAPSLHTADVGVSVANAVDVAKDAADIILRERNLDVLHAGILEGRRAFANVMKYLLMGTSSNFGNVFSMAGAIVFLPFLPMLPTQILLNNFLYDLSQVTIPTDAVDPELLAGPRRWDIGVIRRFMLVIGPISSIFDFATFGILLWGFNATEPTFHTGWFVESLATQTLVLFVIRTTRSPLKSRPSAPLAITTLSIVTIGLALPWTPLAGPLGFAPLPAGFFVFLGGATLTYLLFVEMVKRRLMTPRSADAGRRV